MPRTPLVSRAFGTRHFRYRANMTHIPVCQLCPKKEKFLAPPPLDAVFPKRTLPYKA